MNVERLEQAHQRLQALLSSGTGTVDAWQAQLNELNQAIAELKARPQTHVNTRLIGVSPQWKAWDTDLGYAEPPWVRVDSLTVFRERGKTRFYAKRPGGDDAGQFITDAKNRRKSWKHAITAMACIDRDHPSNDKETWVQKDAAANAGSA